MKSLSEIVQERRCSEQMAAIKSLREQGIKLSCLECGEAISRRRKFALCKKCLPKFRPMSFVDEAAAPA